MNRLFVQLDIEGRVPPDVLRGAVHRQKVYGGSLDTILLERDILAPGAVAEALQAALDLPLAPLDLLRPRKGRDFDRIDGDLVDAGLAYPLGEQDGKLVIAVHPEIPKAALDTLRAENPDATITVTFECLLARLRAEREGTVMPQRYAVLANRVLRALGGSPDTPGTAPPRRERRPTLSFDAPDATGAPGDAASPTEATPDEPPAPAAAEDAPAAPAIRFTPPRATPAAPPLGRFPQPTPTPRRAEAPPTGRYPTATPERTDVGREAETHAPPAAPSATDRPADPGMDATAGEASVPAAGDDAARVPRGGIVGADDAAAATNASPAEAEAPGPDADAEPGAVTSANASDEPTDARTAPDEPAFVAPALARLAVAADRDDVIAALRLTMDACTRRYAIFAVRKDGLVAVAAHRLDPSCVVGTAFAPPRKGLVADLLAGRATTGAPSDDPWLAAAFGLRGPYPAIVDVVRLGRRPVLLVYGDRRGEDVDASARAAVARIVEATARALARVALERRAQGSAPAARTEPEADRDGAHLNLPHLTRSQPKPHRGPTLLGTWAPRGMGTPEADTAPDDGVAAPTDRRRVPPSGPRPEGRPPAEDHVPAPETPPIDGGPSAPDDAPTEPHPHRRTARLGAPDDGAAPPPPRFVPPAVSSARRTTLTTDAPTPPVPPPPTSGVDAADPMSDTLTGLPPAEDELPPPGATRPGIAPLAEPLLDAPARPTVALDAEDRIAEPQPATADAEVGELLDAIVAHEDPRAVARLVELGPAALAAFAGRFPGPIEVIRRDLATMPPPSAHGPLLRAAISLGSAVTPYLLERLSDPNPEVRFYGAFVFQELRDPACIERLTELVFDAHPEVRTIAARVLETYHRAPAFSEACATIRGGLSAPNRVKQMHAARAVGTLRDRDAVPALVDLLSSRDRFVQETALEALCSITGQQHGLKPHRWRAWYEEHGHEHRLEWIMQSLRHRDVLVRRWANDELSRLTGHRVSARPHGDKREQEACYQQWRAWWEEIGRARFDRVARG
ncbi:MAG: hypothetical protein D6705_15220 [Deltaproteobacteria bacterium]|nr:MAG: hypothetical protein D6705_15220 [Deltaproteobacteria bacterium]